MKMLEVLFDEHDLDVFLEAIHFAEDEFKEHLEVMASSKMCEDERAIFDIYANKLTELENLRDNLYMIKEVEV